MTKRKLQRKVKRKNKKPFKHLNLGCKIFLLVMLFAMNEVAKVLPAEDITYFQDMIRLDYCYAALACLDKELRNQLIGLCFASVISHYLQMQDYVNRTPITEWVDKYYFDIQPFLYGSMLGVFIIWVLQQGYSYVREIRQRKTNVPC